jgi:RimJ/RimL family protein N-acetyltransferase
LIQGEKVYLRGLEREDFKLLHEMMNDEEVMRWARSRPDNTVSMEELEKEYEAELRGESARRRTFVIVHKKTQKAVGWATIRWWRPFQTTADIGVAIADRTLRGKGIGTEVNMLLTRLVFEQYNMHKVELWTRGDNPAAIRSAEKNGYKIEGRSKESVYFDGKFYDGIHMGLLRDEYEKLKSRARP